MSRGEKHLSSAAQFDMSITYYFCIQEAHSTPVKVILQMSQELWNSPPKVTCKSGRELQTQALQQLCTLSKLHGAVPFRVIGTGITNRSAKLKMMQEVQWQDTKFVQHYTDEVVILQIASGADLASLYQCSGLYNVPVCSS